MFMRHFAPTPFFIFYNFQLVQNFKEPMQDLIRFLLSLPQFIRTFDANGWIDTVKNPVPYSANIIANSNGDLKIVTYRY